MSGWFTQDLTLAEVRTLRAVERLPLEGPLLAALARRGLDGAGSPVSVQSFEPSGLRALRGAAPGLQLVQLTRATGLLPDLEAGGRRTHPDLMGPAGVVDVAAYADVLAPDEVSLTGATAAAPALVDDAHAAGLLVIPYTLRAERLPAGRPARGG